MDGQECPSDTYGHAFIRITAKRMIATENEKTSAHAGRTVFLNPQFQGGDFGLGCVG